MKAELLFHEKRAVSGRSGKIGIVEIKVWKIPSDKYYPEGLKFSLFLVCDSEIVIGIDNHKPKGPHLHFEGGEFAYSFTGEKKLLQDFWSLVSKKGFSL